MSQKPEAKSVSSVAKPPSQTPRGLEYSNINTPLLELIKAEIRQRIKTHDHKYKIGQLILCLLSYKFGMWFQSKLNETASTWSTPHFVSNQSINKIIARYIGALDNLYVQRETLLA
jgi:hypothetical protein